MSGFPKLKPCPWCEKNAVHVAVCDDEGNYHGELGCDYEKKSWSGLSYALYHDGWGDCILCTDDANSFLGGVLFDTAEEAVETWNNPGRDARADNVVIGDNKQLTNREWLASLSDDELSRFLTLGLGLDDLGTYVNIDSVRRMFVQSQSGVEEWLSKPCTYL